MGWLVNGSKIGSHDPTCAVCNDIRRHSIQAVNQLLTTMCSNHNWRSSNRPCNPTSIVNPFSRLWILFPLSCSRTSIDLKLLIIAQTFPAYFFCNSLNDKKQTINENNLPSFHVGHSDCQTPSWLKGERCCRNWFWYEEAGFGAPAGLQHPCYCSSRSVAPVTTHR